MEMRNTTVVTEFILLGFSDHPKHQATLFSIFLSVYLLSLVGNILIISVVNLDPQLNTPMYFFLGNLSFVDLCLTSVTVPLLLVNLLSADGRTSVPKCITQMYFFILLVTTESILLGVMAYDRYVAICNPLRYNIVMSRKQCVLLVVESWGVVALHSLMHTLMACRLSFCGPNVIPSFFCDVPAVLKLSCSDTTPNQLLILVEGSATAAFPLLFIVVSYINIASTILRLQSSQKRQKAISTCSSHLMVVILFYGTICFMYFRPSSVSSLDYDRAVSVMYTFVTPMLNSFIYSLRNKEIKAAIRRILRKKHFPC
ncbi:olfactory receptor 5J3-like [Ambystoma mexicanum]|uniref:olfactory receptor 5J3-like n=1 Tax=Ambystoma mexicanum TaxID=8296 RepID=UPI0037E7BF14